MIRHRRMAIGRPREHGATGHRHRRREGAVRCPQPRARRAGGRSPPGARRAVDQGRPPLRRGPERERDRRALRLAGLRVLRGAAPRQRSADPERVRGRMARRPGRRPAGVQGQHDARDAPHPERGGRWGRHLLARGARRRPAHRRRPERVSVNGGGKPREHLRRCVEAGRAITVEDVHEIDLIQEVAAELATVAKVRFRLKPIAPKLWRRSDFTQATVPTTSRSRSTSRASHGVRRRDGSTRPRDAQRRAGRAAHALRQAAPEHLVLEGLMTWFGRTVVELCHAWDGWRPRTRHRGGYRASGTR